MTHKRKEWKNVRKEVCGEILGRAEGEIGKHVAAPTARQTRNSIRAADEKGLVTGGRMGGHMGGAEALTLVCMQGAAPSPKQLRGFLIITPTNVPLTLTPNYIFSRGNFRF